MSEQRVRRILFAYPQIYHACHTRHARGERSGHALTDRETQVLAHLDENEATSPVKLARHLGITAGTLSPLLERLAELGLLSRERHADDKRRLELKLTAEGRREFTKHSVLSPERVATALARLTEAEREIAALGLELLARAAGAMTFEGGRERKWLQRPTKKSRAHMRKGERA